MIGELFVEVLNLLAALSILIGLTANALGIIGILRFPDVYTRLHADTKATTFGTIFTSLAVILWAVKSFFLSGDGQYVNLAVHTVFAVVVLGVTNATGAHAIARAAYRSGIRPSPAVVDHLAERMNMESAVAVAGAEPPADEKEESHG